MKEVTMHQTYDKKIHESERDAEKYLNARYADIILKISHNIADATFEHYPISIISTYIDENLKEFEKLMIIKEDMKKYEREEKEEDF